MEPQHHPRASRGDFELYLDTLGSSHTNICNDEKLIIFQDLDEVALLPEAPRSPWT